MSGVQLEYEVLIREHHLDTFGHVNNAVYLQLYEEARWEYITRRGFDFGTIQRTGIAPVILGVELKFKKEIKLREKIRITGKTISYARRIGHLWQEMLNESDQVCSTADFTFGLWNTHERKLISPTPEWLHAIGWRSEGGED